jgi:hypothetical protein
MTEMEKDTHAYVLNRYESSIEYYWNAGAHNKRAYKLTRSLTIVLGALVTLISSISTAEFITSNSTLQLPFAIATPVLAAILTIAGGFAQSFHWGAAWRDMVINAQKLEKELDRFKVTSPDQIDLAKEVTILNELVIEETQSFFLRILDSAKTLRKDNGRGK